MGKLFEILAVEADVENKVKTIMQEAITTFQKRSEHFVGSIRTLKMFDAERQNEEAGFEERKDIVTTVQKKLDYTWESIVKYYDVIAQKEVGNQNTHANVTINGEVILSNMPATLLLGLESRLKKVREMYLTIPTLAPGTEWVPDESIGEGVFRAKFPEIRHRTEKTVEHKIIVQPTKEHPAQVEKWTSSVPVGNFTTDRWCGMISPAKKSQLLDRIDTLIEAIKQARQRANEVQLENVKVGEIIKNFIHE